MESFNEASKKIGITQSALSMAIKQLEVDLGTKLFDRNVSGIKLTSQGLALLQQLEGFEKEISKGVSNALKQTDSTPIKIACVPHFGSKFLLPYLNSKKKELPTVQLFMVWSFDGFKAVQEGEMDFAFVAWSRRPKELNYIEIKPDPAAFVGSKKHFPDLPYAKVLDDLKNYPLVHLPKPQYPWTQAVGVSKPGFLVRDNLSARDLILGGHGVGYLQLDIFSNAEQKMLCQAEIPGKYPHAHIYVVFHKNISNSSKALMENLIDGLSRESARQF